MKKLITTLAASLLLVSILFAGHQSRLSKLELRLWDYSSFSVELDHRVYNSVNSTFVIGNLEPGRHHLKVVRKIRRHNGFFTQVIFHGQIKIPASSKVKARITKSHRYDVLKTTRIKKSHHSNHGHNSHGNSSHGHNSHESNSYGYNGTSQGNTGHNSHFVSSCGHSEIISDYSFTNLMRAIDETSFDSNKLEVFKQATQHVLLSSHQVLDLIELFSFDDNRLEAAKFAYARTYDKENYFMVNEGISFSANRHKLNTYISSFHF